MLGNPVRREWRVALVAALCWLMAVIGKVLPAGRLPLR